MQHPNDNDEDDDLLIHRTLPTSETNFTLLFDDDLV
jgi:hypothetical protein